MNFKHLFGIFCIILCLMPMAFAGNLMVLHGKAYDGNLLMTTGDVRIQLYTAQSGGSLIYDSVGDFTGAIKNGLFDVLLGSGIPLDVNYGQYYYYALQINGKDINFGTSLRQVFQSSHGDLNIYPISQLINDKGYLVPSALTPYLTKVDANGFYAFKTDVNLWTNQLLVPYLTKSDANGFYALKADVNIWTQQLLVPYTLKSDTNIWIVQKLAPYLLQVDANGFFAFKSDVNLWANQLLVPYLLKTDANGFYAFKTDVNLWTQQLLVPYLLQVDANGFYYNKSDINASFLSKVDANGFYPLKTDVNVWIDQKLANFPTVDTNWQTSWTVFDANMKATYTQLADTNIWINQKLVPYLTKVDANGFYAYKADVNLWGDMRYIPLSQNVLTSEPTGFTDGSNINIDYNRISRTIKLTGPVVAYWDGNLIPALVSGWESSSHTATNGAWYLYYDGTNFIWSQTTWTFNMLQIAAVFYDTNAALDTFGVRETHGLMQWQAHKEFHQTVGTFLSAGGDLNGYVLGSTVATNRRPTVSSTTINDEDLQTTNPDLNNALYTKYYVTGTNATSVFTENTAEFILVNGNIPYYNQFTGGAWQLTPMPNNNYQAIWLVAIPTTSDTNSQKYRYIWVMGQSISPTLSTIQAITPTSLNLGQISNFTNEFVFIDRVIIQLSGGGGGNWNIVQIDKLTGTKLTQVASPAGNYLSTVETDATLTGNGTIANPLHVVLTDTNWQTSWSLFDANMKYYFALNSDVNIWTNQLLVPYLTKLDANGFYALKSDVNIWAAQLDVVQQLDANMWYLLKTDANQFYAFKTDVNLWGDQRYLPINTVLMTDTNWQTSWNVFDANMRYYFALNTDVNAWTNQLLVPYLTKVDANGFYALKTDVNVWIDQKLVPYLLQVDANGFFTLKTDTNVWIDQRLVPYLLQTDANAFYAYKTDVNLWGDQRYIPIGTPGFVDTNWQTSWNVFDANMRYYFALTTDVNLWGDQRYIPIGAPGYTDTNWQTSWNVFDANMRYYFALTTDVNLWGDQRYIPIGTPGFVDTNWQTSWNVFDANMRFYFALKSDVNLWTNQLLVPYLLQTDANGFYAYKTDVNLWGDQRYIPIGAPGFTDTNWQTSWSVFDANMKATYTQIGDTNIWINQKLVPYLLQTDANGFYAYKTDVNLWGDQRYLPINTTFIDTNWETSWTVFDANMSATYTKLGDTNVWINQKLVPYLLQVDANGFYAYKTDVNLWGDQRYLPINTTFTDTNWQTSWTVFDANMSATYTKLGDTNVWIDQKLIPYLTKVDANGFYTLKTDTNIWIDQKLVPYLLALDANAFYAYKTDVNTWGDQRYLPINTVLPIDTNWQTSWSVFDANMRYYFALNSDVNVWTNQLLVPYLTKVDANGFYAYKTDVNTWGDQRYLPINTVFPIDTNWQTSWSVFDANMRYYFALNSDVNVWTNQLLVPYLTKVDANGFYTLKTDTNVWIDQKLVPYLLQTDANGFYPLKGDVNTWAGQLDIINQADYNMWYLLKTDANNFYAFKSDVNLWGDQRYLPINTVLMTDTNWQTSWAVFDSNIKATYSTYFVTQTDGNAWYVKQTDGNIWYVKQVDGNMWYQLKSDFNIDLNAGISLQSCSSGYALQSLGTSFTCISVAGTDTNWQTSWPVFDANMKATYTQLNDTNIWIDQKIAGISGIVDTNWQTSWPVFDANMRATFVPYIGAINDVNLGLRHLISYAHISAGTDESYGSLTSKSGTPFANVPGYGIASLGTIIQTTSSWNGSGFMLLIMIQCIMVY